LYGKFIDQIFNVVQCLRACTHL